MAEVFDCQFKDHKMFMILRGESMQISYNHQNGVLGRLFWMWYVKYMTSDSDRNIRNKLKPNI